MSERATDPAPRGGARRRASRRALAHPVATVRRLVSEHASPRNLALAAALGTFVGSLPFTGYHTVAVVYLAGRLRLNRLLALTANQIGIPPFVPFLCIEAGYLMRHGRLLTEVSIRTVWDEAADRMLEWVIGSLVVAPALAVAVGLVVWGLGLLTARSAGPPPAVPVAGEAVGDEETAAPAGQP